jgi:hypothetical protein
MLPGILAEPGARVEQAPLCAVFLNAGALRRIGPGRMWVDVSRLWAARGVPTVRIDLEGIGEADGDDAPYSDTAALYVPKLVEQTIATLDALSDRGLPPRFVLIGLCSGAYWSFQAALRDDRVSAAYLVNPRALFWDEAVEHSRSMRRAAKLTRGSSWRRLLRGEVPMSEVRSVARGALAMMRRPGSLASSRRTQCERLDHALDDLESSGTRLLLAFGGNEPLFDELEREGRIDEMSGRPGIEMAIMPGSDHTVRPLATQRYLASLLDDALSTELRRPVPQPVGGR